MSNNLENFTAAMGKYQVLMVRQNKLKIYEISALEAMEVLSELEFGGQNLGSKAGLISLVTKNHKMFISLVSFALKHDPHLIASMLKDGRFTLEEFIDLAIKAIEVNQGYFLQAVEKIALSKVNFNKSQKTEDKSTSTSSEVASKK